jgi:hypothetical protein
MKHWGWLLAAFHPLSHPRPAHPPSAHDDDPGRWYRPPSVAESLDGGHALPPGWCARHSDYLARYAEQVPEPPPGHALPTGWSPDRQAAEPGDGWRYRAGGR